MGAPQAGPSRTREKSAVGRNHRTLTVTVLVLWLALHDVGWLNSADGQAVTQNRPGILVTSETRPRAAEEGNTTTGEAHVPVNSTLTCQPPNSTCSKAGQTLEQHCWMRGMSGRGEWKDPDDGCSRLLYWHIVTADTHRIVIEARFFSKTTRDKFEFWDPSWPEWADLSSRPQPLPLANSTLRIHVVMEKSRRYMPFITVQYTSQPADKMPRKSGYSRGYKVYDCKSPYTVPEVWRCDFVPQCDGGEDEMDCGYQSPGCQWSASEPWIPFGDHCLLLVKSRNSRVCQTKHNATMALLMNLTERDLVVRIHRRTANFHSTFSLDLVYFNLTLVNPVSARLSHLYAYLWQYQGKGGPISYQDILPAIKHRSHKIDLCMQLSVPSPTEYELTPTSACKAASEMTVCMKVNALYSQPLSVQTAVNLAQARLTPTGIRTKVCSDGSLVHLFHVCPHGDRTDASEWSEHRLPLFLCTSGPAVHNTLVCDGHPDCDDASDENKCNQAHLTLLPDTMFVCDSGGQIVPTSQKCNKIHDCYDKSDETGTECSSNSYLQVAKDTLVWYNSFVRKDQVLAPPAVVELDGYGAAVITELSPQEEGCKETHFQCPDGFCIPTYLLNNGEKDCLGGEDENIAKYNFTCPGFYRCLESNSCVHPKYVCDGIPHCLHHDDERYCHLPCPQNCSCEGHAFTCQQAFDYQQYFETRYLDLSGTWQPLLEDIHFLPFLVYLNLSNCGLSVVSQKSLPLLTVLDLSENEVKHVLQTRHLTGTTSKNMSRTEVQQTTANKMMNKSVQLSFSGNKHNVSDTAFILPNLRFLKLSKCKLSRVFVKNMQSLNVLDLSYNEIGYFPELQLENLHSLRELDLSGNPLTPHLDSEFVLLTQRANLTSLRTLTMIGIGAEHLISGVFGHLTALTELNLKDNPLRYLSQNAFGDLAVLGVLRADEGRVCCEYFRQGTLITECDASIDELSSCEDLLRTDFFRLFLWVFCVLTITGNAGVLIFRLFIEKEGTSLAYRVLVVNLSMSDFFMGVYLAIIGSVDAQLRGVYVAKENSWRESNTCKVAGFFAFVSSEASALAVCLITLDRFLVIKFPFSSSARLTKVTAHVACVVTWGFALIVAAVPLIPKNWEFYGQSGICLPLPITQRTFKGQHYSFGVFIVLNFVLFLIIGVGQGLIFHSIHSTAMATMKDHHKRDAVIARRLFLIVCTDFCCWFPIGLMGLLASRGTPIPGMVNVLASVFMLPLNAALNPFLYTINAFRQRRAKKREQKRLEKMISRIHVEIRSWPSDKVEELVQLCLKMNLVHRQRILQGFADTRNDEAESPTCQGQAEEPDDHRSVPGREEPVKGN